MRMCMQSLIKMKYLRNKTLRTDARTHTQTDGQLETAYCPQTQFAGEVYRNENHARQYLDANSLTLFKKLVLINLPNRWAFQPGATQTSEDCYRFEI